MKRKFDGQKTTKLGTEKNPAVVSVQTKERMKEVASIFEEKGWKCKIGLEPDKPEDIKYPKIAPDFGSPSRRITYSILYVFNRLWNEDTQ